MQHDHSTGPSGSRRNVHRIGPSTAALKSRKPRNRFRTFLEKFCALSPQSRLRVLKALLADRETQDHPSSPCPPPDAAFFLRNGISRTLWERYKRAQAEAWRTEGATREGVERFGKEPTP